GRGDGPEPLIEGGGALGQAPGPQPVDKYPVPIGRVGRVVDAAHAHRPHSRPGRRLRRCPSTLLASRPGRRLRRCPSTLLASPPPGARSSPRPPPPPPPPPARGPRRRPSAPPASRPGRRLRRRPSTPCCCRHWSSPSLETRLARRASPMGRARRASQAVGDR